MLLQNLFLDPRTTDKISAISPNFILANKSNNNALSACAR